MSYAVKEIFFTLQGEGAQTGRPAVFCRFAGCNLWSGREEDRSRACASSVIRTLLELMEPGEDVSILRRPWPPQSRKPGRNIEDIPSHLWYALVENPFCSWTSL